MSDCNARYLNQFTTLTERARTQKIKLPRATQVRCLNAALTLRKMLTVSPHSMSCEQLRMVGKCQEEFSTTYVELKHVINQDGSNLENQQGA